MGEKPRRLPNRTRRAAGPGRLLLAACAAVAVAGSLVTSSDVGATTRGPPAAGRLQALIAAFAKAHPTFPGVAGAVSTRGGVWEGAAGPSRRGGGPPLTSATTFRVASVTKSFVAAATLRLVESGRVRLDAPV